jgi:hypothetical protein
VESFLRGLNVTFKLVIFICLLNPSITNIKTQQDASIETNYIQSSTAVLLEDYRLIVERFARPIHPDS